jgi:Flp pilus assembly protein TadD
MISMRRTTIAKLAVSTLMLGVTTVGCKPAADASRPRSAAQFGNKVEQQAGKLIDVALSAAARRDFASAVTNAEAAVVLVPQDAGYRTTLGDLYLKAGRFQSAADAYATRFS